MIHWFFTTLCELFVFYRVSLFGFKGLLQLSYNSKKHSHERCLENIVKLELSNDVGLSNYSKDFLDTLQPKQKEGTVLARNICFGCGEQFSPNIGYSYFEMPKKYQKLLCPSCCEKGKFKVIVEPNDYVTGIKGLGPTGAVGRTGATGVTGPAYPMRDMRHGVTAYYNAEPRGMSLAELDRRWRETYPSERNIT